MNPSHGIRKQRTASDPWNDGLPPHVPARGPLPRVCLLPGDPARVDMTRAVLTDFEEVGYRREFRLATGRYNGVPVAICSTGIGGPSTEIAVVELARLGVETFLRVGGMGAMPASIVPGSLTTVAAVLRESGAARFYADDDEPIDAHPDVLAALDAAAGIHGEELTPVRVLTCDSYYVGEGRPVPGLEERAARRLAHIEATGADAMDMECETIFAVARALGARFGGILAAHGNRATDEWLDDYEPTQQRMLRIALEAAALLTA